MQQNLSRYWLKARADYELFLVRYLNEIVSLSLLLESTFLRRKFIYTTDELPHHSDLQILSVN